MSGDAGIYPATASGRPTSGDCHLTNGTQAPQTVRRTLPELRLHTPKSPEWAAPEACVAALAEARRVAISVQSAPARPALLRMPAAEGEVLGPLYLALLFHVEHPRRLPRRPETGDRRPETGDRRPETGDRRPETGDRRPETGDRRPETGDRRPETGDRRPETGDRRPETQVSRETACRSSAPGRRERKERGLTRTQPSAVLMGRPALVPRPGFGAEARGRRCIQRRATERVELASRGGSP
ncbi:hypothetical protein BJ973_007199 [Actinoplanes tereljensis]